MCALTPRVAAPCRLIVDAAPCPTPAPSALPCAVLTLRPRLSRHIGWHAHCHCPSLLPPAPRFAHATMVLKRPGPARHGLYAPPPPPLRHHPRPSASQLLTQASLGACKRHTVSLQSARAPTPAARPPPSRAQAWTAKPAPLRMQAFCRRKPHRGCAAKVQTPPDGATCASQHSACAMDPRSLG